jgi:hypothetical protein
MCGKGKGQKFLSIHGLHSLIQYLQQYLKTYHGLHYAHSYTNNVANEYPNY